MRLGTNVVVAAPEGFSYERRKNHLAIFHHGVLAATLRGERAAKFLAEDGGRQDQMLMARVTGNYRRGNERHQRDRRRDSGR